MANDISTVIDLNIQRLTRVPSVQGLQTIAVFSSEAAGIFGASEKVKTYSTTGALKQLTDDGFSQTGDTYKAVSAIASQSPVPRTVKVVRQDPDAAKVVDVLLGGGNVGQGDYTVTIDGTDFEHNEPDNTRDLEQILNSIATLIDANADYTATVPGGDNFIRVTGPAGVDFAISGVAPANVNFNFVVETPVVNAVSSVASSIESDPDWYFLLDTNTDSKHIVAMAKYFETIKKLYFYQTSESSALNTTDNNDSTSTPAQLKALNLDRSVGLACLDADSIEEFKAAAWLANRAVATPGASTWKFKTARGVTADEYTTQQLENLKNKNANVYVGLGGTGISIFEEGVVSSGEYIDIMRGTDALEGRIQQLLATLFTTRDKVPYTDGGIEVIGLQIERALDEYVEVGLLVGSDVLDENEQSLGPVVTVPTRAETTAAERSSREVNNITFSASYAGAVHKVTINGTVSV